MKTITNFQVEPFSGFYNTIWEPGDYNDDAICDMLDLESIDALDNYNFNSKRYMTDISVAYVNFVKTAIAKIFDTTIEVSNVEVVSPREYNFTTDRIFCDLIVGDVDKFYKKLINLVRSDLPHYADIIKTNFTSHSGFISFVSNDIEVWLDQMEGDVRLLSHLVGLVLQKEYMGTCDNNDLISAIEQDGFNELTCNGYSMWSYWE